MYYHLRERSIFAQSIVQMIKDQKVAVHVRAHTHMAVTWMSMSVSTMQLQLLQVCRCNLLQWRSSEKTDLIAPDLTTISA